MDDVFAYIDPGLIGNLGQTIYLFFVGAFAIVVVRPWRFLKSRLRRGVDNEPREAEETADVGKPEA